eukprot:COSAG03_NODE_11507_length_588_cov_40.398773_1_plen_195_part_11
MAGFMLAMPTLLPESVLSAEGEDAQAVKSSWENASSPSIEPGGVGAAWLAAEQSRVLAPPVAHQYLVRPFWCCPPGTGICSASTPTSATWLPMRTVTCSSIILATLSEQKGLTQLWRCPARVSGLEVEMAVEEKMTPEDQHGGYSHPTAHSCSTDPPTPSGTSTVDYMTSSVGIRARQQVLVSITLPPSLRLPPG